MKLYIYSIITAIIFSADNSIAQNYCIADRFSEIALFDSSEIRIDSNIVFANPFHAFTHAQVELKMDIYSPSFIADTFIQRPFILLVHGGGFLAGSRKEMSYECMEYARRGFVCATIDYRLGWNCAATDVLSICLFCQSLNNELITATYCAAQDARAAMRTIYANSSLYRIDPNYLFIGGESAGGITAMHAAFWDQTEANAFDPNAISRAGILDTAGNSLPSNYQIRGVINSCGAVSKDSIVLNNGNIPVINFHDELDCVVPSRYGQVISCLCQPYYWAAGSEILYSILTSSGTCSQYYQVPLSTGHCSFPKPQLIQKASCFIKTIFCNSCQSSFSNQPGIAVSCSALNDINQEDNYVPLTFCELLNTYNGNYVLQRKHAIGSILFQLLDSTGKLVLSGELNPGEQEKIISLQSFSSGIYLLHTTTSNSSKTFKIENH